MKGLKSISQLRNEIKTINSKMNKIPKKGRTANAQLKHNSKRKQLQNKKQILNNELRIESIQTLQRAARKTIKKKGMPNKQISRKEIERILKKNAEMENLLYIANLMGEEIDLAKLYDSESNNNTNRAREIVKQLAIEGQLKAEAQKQSFERKQSKRISTQQTVNIGGINLNKNSVVGIAKFKPKSKQQRKESKKTNAPHIQRRFGGQKKKGEQNKDVSQSVSITEIIPIIGNRQGLPIHINKEKLLVGKSVKNETRRLRRKTLTCKSCGEPMRPVPYQGSEAEKSSKYMCCTGTGNIGIKKEKKGCGACNFNRIINSD